MIEEPLFVAPVQELHAPVQLTRSTPVGKRIIDTLVSCLFLLLVSPILLLVALAIRLDSPGPIIFKTRRVGKDGKPFVMYKFRTMREDAEIVLKDLGHLNLGGPYMIKIPNDPRVTRVGRFLRKTSIDEVPQLLNVIKGEMSIVGPRPQAPNEVALYTASQRRRLEALPGITGLWQVTCRHSPSFEDWIRLDTYYVDHWSLWLDARIVMKTFVVIVKDIRRKEN